MSVFKAFSHFWEYGRGGGRRRGVGYIVKISPMNILTTGKDCRLPSNTIFDIYNFPVKL
jgi:hypothetical protein